MCLDGLHVLRCVVCAWMGYMCLDVLYVLHVLRRISTLRLKTEALPECGSSRSHQFLLLNANSFSTFKFFFSPVTSHAIKSICLNRVLIPIVED